MIIVLFIIYHLLHFTGGIVGYTAHAYTPEQVYNNVIYGFQVWYVSAFYIVAMIALGFHLYHGVWSMFQTLGLMSTRSNRGFRLFASVLAVAVVLGNISIPISVLLGVLKPYTG